MVSMDTVSAVVRMHLLSGAPDYLKISFTAKLDLAFPYVEADRVPEPGSIVQPYFGAVRQDH